MQLNKLNYFLKLKIKLGNYKILNLFINFLIIIIIKIFRSRAIPVCLNQLGTYGTSWQEFTKPPPPHCFLCHGGFRMLVVLSGRGKWRSKKKSSYGTWDWLMGVTRGELSISLLTFFLSPSIEVPVFHVLFYLFNFFFCIASYMDAVELWFLSDPG